jgi:hypothetical protein
MAFTTLSGIDVPFGGVANIQNNLVTHSDRAFTAGSFSFGTYAFNDAFGSLAFDWGECDSAGCTTVSAPANNVSADPLYCQDFSLQIGSPARNTGNPAILNPDETRSDLGAYGGPEAILPSITCGGPITSSMFVISNLADASFTITGPTTLSANGKVSLFPNLPSGPYTITYGDVSGFLKPPTQTLTLNAGSTVNFIGNYRRLIFVAFPGLGTSATDATSVGTLVCETTGNFPRNPSACTPGATIVPASLANTFDWDTPNQGSGSPTEFIVSSFRSAEDLVAIVGYGGNRAQLYATYLRSAYGLTPPTCSGPPPLKIKTETAKKVPLKKAGRSFLRSCDRTQGNPEPRLKGETRSYP